MLPVIHIIPPVTPQVPLVNTAMPGSTVVHVPYDTVAPSVSSASVDPNASGNKNPRPDTPAPAAAEAAPQIAAQGNPQDFDRIGAPATFLAQLMGQKEVSPQTQGILMQYEQQLDRDNVKYKPSNAGKPAAEPAGMFGRILREDHSPKTQPPPSPAEPAEKSAAHIVGSAPRLQARLREAKPVDAKTPRAGEAAGVKAYTQTIARNHAPKDSLTDSI